MFHIPKEIKIGGHVYTIETSEKVLVRESSPATVYHYEKKIEIDSAVAASYKEEALLHEIIEAINSLYELKLEHHVVTTLAEGLYQVLVDNIQNFKEKGEEDEKKEDGGN